MYWQLVIHRSPMSYWPSPMSDQPSPMSLHSTKQCPSQEIAFPTPTVILEVSMGGRGPTISCIFCLYAFCCLSWFMIAVNIYKDELCLKDKSSWCLQATILNIGYSVVASCVDLITVSSGTILTYKSNAFAKVCIFTRFAHATPGPSDSRHASTRAGPRQLSCNANLPKAE